MDTRRLARPRAFTLIELLVVVSIIALLMSILMPSLGKSRAVAERTVCGTRLKGITTAMLTYITEFNDSFPMNGLIIPKRGTPAMYDPSQTPGADPKGFIKFSETNPNKWRLEFGALWTYMGGREPPTGYSLPLPLAPEAVRKAFICPGDLRDGMSRTFNGGADGTNPVQPLYLSAENPPRIMQGVGAPGFWSYSVNSVLNPLGRFRDRFAAGELPWSDPLRRTKVRSETEFICFIEEDSNSLFNDEVMDPPAYSQGDQLTNRHNGMGNVGCLDGHVESWSQTVFDQVPSAIAGQYVSHSEAMVSPITRKFFPDGGSFVAP